MPSTKKLLTAAAGSAGGDKLFVEDVFSTYLYEGNATSTQTITNGIDLDGEGGLVWIKNRDAVTSHILFDNEAQVLLNSNSSGSGGTGYWPTYFNFNSDGFTTTNVVGDSKTSGEDFASWSFRKAEGFFDIQTWTGNGTAGKVISHNLNSVPKMIWVKRTDTSGEWRVYHWRLGNDAGILLNDAGSAGGYAPLNNTTPTSSQFVLNDNANVNANGGTYVAYLFGEDAVFGEDGDEQICKIDRYNGTGTSGLTVDVGFEPQWILVKCNGNPWGIMDIMRGANGQAARSLQANSTSTEQTVGQYSTAAVQVTSTGFTLMTDDEGGGNANNTVYLYMAIRRPMKVPEAGTEVFAIGQGDGDADVPDFISNFPVDVAITKRTSAGNNGRMSSRLTGATYLSPNLSQLESADSAATFDFMNGWGSDGANRNTDEYAWQFKRASQFMDVVAYTGNGTAGTTQAHNLTVVPEFIMWKNRTGTNDSWISYWSTLGVDKYLLGFNTTTGLGTGSLINNTAPTASVITLSGQGWNVNNNGSTYVAYLFTTLAGISKVGSVVHSGTTNVDCGFSAGARFVFVRRTDASGGWYVWDSVRGIVAGNDPYLLLNTTAAQVTNTDYIDPLASGFTLTSSFTAGTYVFLAIA